MAHAPLRRGLRTSSSTRCGSSSLSSGTGCISSARPRTSDPQEPTANCRCPPVKRRSAREFAVARRDALGPGVSRKASKRREVMPASARHCCSGARRRPRPASDSSTRGECQCCSSVAKDAWRSRCLEGQSSNCGSPCGGHADLWRELPHKLTRARARRLPPRRQIRRPARGRAARAS